VRVSTGSHHGAPLSGFKFAPNIAFSPDGKTVATGSTEEDFSPSQNLRLWDVASGRPLSAPLHLGPLAQDTKGVISAQPHIAFSPDGTLLVASRIDRSLRVWDIAGRQERSTPMLGHTEQVNSVAFSPDGKTLVSGGADKTLRVWDVASGRALGAYKTLPFGHITTNRYRPRSMSRSRGSARSPNSANGPIE
jgi:WD40 repeat protein